ncbi:MAG: 50S ribosomal protein P1 [Candidatus Aenigmarchaeota archaeon ex4484_56]|nr:MAG: 50S ribosomal protein P1 [Candidatus Aenigmarchaeota archaeon ex4484_56]
MGLEYIHAALLLHEAKKDITEESITKILESAGVEVDKAIVKATVNNLKDINIDEVLNSAVAVPTVQTPQIQEQGTGGEGEKKEEKKEDEGKKEEEAAAGLGALFG